MNIITFENPSFIFFSLLFSLKERCPFASLFPPLLNLLTQQALCAYAPICSWLWAGRTARQRKHSQRLQAVRWGLGATPATPRTRQTCLCLGEPSHWGPAVWRSKWLASASECPRSLTQSQKSNLSACKNMPENPKVSPTVSVLSRKISPNN